MSAAESPPSHIREKLKDMHSSFDMLGGSVEEDTRKRREIMKRRNDEMLVSIAKIEKTLSLEIKRRTESVMDTHQNVDQALGTMMSHFQNRILERFERLQGSVDGLGERCSTLERGIRQFKGELPSKLQVETASLFRSIKDLTTDFDSDRRQRAERDAQLERQVQDAEYQVDVKNAQELARFERCSETLQDLIEDFSSAEKRPEFAARRAEFFGQIHELRERLVEEATTRERTDDRVVQAINEYTTTLHRSLQLAHVTS